MRKVMTLCQSFCNSYKIEYLFITSYYIDHKFIIMWKSKKISPVSKKDKRHIIETLFGKSYPSVPTTPGWVNKLQNIDKDSLCKSIAQVLNSSLDYLPSDIVNQSHDLLNLREKGNTITLNDLLATHSCQFRFAPSPSGHLHIGHFIPVIMNILLRQVCRNYGHESDMIIRIDNTNNDEDDYSKEVLDVLFNTLMGQARDNIYRSSEQKDMIIGLIDQSIMSGDDKFYVDCSDQPTIRAQRVERIDNAYRRHDTDTVMKLWTKMKAGDLNGVIRAKISMKSDNGNLRDPVMIRMIKDLETKKNILMPMYDLVCPVLDSWDATRSGRVLIAMRDGNYFDRLDQYRWIQKALNLTPTALLTFSRINFKDVILSKRKIKELIEAPESGIDQWSDPRLCTLSGMLNRGMTIEGLLNFYWMSGSLSTGNRSTSQDIGMLFASNNKIMCNRICTIIDRYPVTDKPMKLNADQFPMLIIQCKGIKIDNVATVYVDRKKIVSHNLANINRLIQTTGIDQDKLYMDYDKKNLHNPLFVDNLDTLMFKTPNDMKKGEIIKINNFKDLDDDMNFPGYYIIFDLKRNAHGDCTSVTALHVA